MSGTEGTTNRAILRYRVPATAWRRPAWARACCRWVASRRPLNRAPAEPRPPVAPPNRTRFASPAHCARDQRRRMRFPRAAIGPARADLVLPNGCRSNRNEARNRVRALHEARFAFHGYRQAAAPTPASEQWRRRPGGGAFEARRVVRRPRGQPARRGGGYAPATAAQRSAPAYRQCVRPSSPMRNRCSQPLSSNCRTGACLSITRSIASCGASMNTDSRAGSCT